ncbi:oligosaccharide flippase family protein [Polynucleobacter paneuropaeus]|nr:oligosaccharide flippase family protein [Polynucleobacter paneuropaeus]
MSNKKNFILMGSYMTLVNVVTGSLAYIYQIAMARMLSKEDFVLLSIVLSALMLVSSPLSAISLWICGKVAINKKMHSYAESINLYKKVNLALVSGMAGLGILSIIQIEFIEKIVKHEITIFVLISAILLCLIYWLNAINNAFYQGEERFFLISINSVLNIFGKIFLSILLIYWQFNLLGAIWGGILSGAIIWIVFNYTNNKLTRPDVGISGATDLSSKFFPILLASVSFSVMMQLDIIFVNYYFSADTSSKYIAASILGKVILYISAGLVQVMYPMISGSESSALSSQGDRSTLRHACLATIGMCTVIIIFYVFWGDKVITMLYGDSYKGSGQLLVIYSCAIFPMAIVMLAEHYLLAKNQLLFTWLFVIFAPLEMLLIYCFHATPEEIILCIGICTSTLCILGYMILYKKKLI